jgi:hypothetical protein
VASPSSSLTPGGHKMAKYAQYLFNLQHKIDHTVIEKHMRMNAYEEQSI